MPTVPRRQSKGPRIRLRDGAVRIRGRGPTLTAKQRRTLFVLAARHGFDLDGVRALCPQGRVSLLTRTEADGLIDRLSVGIETRRPRPRRGRRASAGQLRLIAELIRSTGVSPNWLSRFGAAALADIREHVTAQRIIGALGAIQRARDPKAQRIALEAPPGARHGAVDDGHRADPADAATGEDGALLGRV